jgi:uncharacterized Zn finger protein (UPF0148 family)
MGRVSCPKCDTPAPTGAAACPRCGLAVERWSSFDRRPPSHPPVDEAWAALEASWADEAAHKRFVERAAETDGLDVAAARYRAVVRARPDDEPARRGLERVAALAETLHAARMRAERARPPTPLLRWLTVGLATALLLAVGWITLSVLLQKHP